MCCSAEDFQSPGVTDVLEALAVHFEDLVAALEANILGFWLFVDFGDEDSEVAVVPSEDLEVEGFVSVGSSQDDVSYPIIQIQIVITNEVNQELNDSAMCKSTSRDGCYEWRRKAASRYLERGGAESIR